MVPRQDALAQPLPRLLRLALHAVQLRLRLRLRLLVGVVGPVQRGEALQVQGRPRVLALQQLVDLALRRGPRLDGRGVGGARGLQAGPRGAEAGFLGGDGRFEGFDARVAGEVVEAAGGDEEGGLEVVH